MSTEHYLTKLAAIFYADVAGYSRLTGQDEVGTHQRLGAYLDALSAAIGQRHGRVVHYAGDAVLADFASVAEALSCALEIQRELEVRNTELAEHDKVRFRIGINLGEVIVDRNDIYGDGVNVAARLENLAEPGGICVSDAVRVALGTKLPLEYESLGEQTVKNIAEPVRAYRVHIAPEAALPARGESHGGAAAALDTNAGQDIAAAKPSKPTKWWPLAVGLLASIAAGAGYWASILPGSSVPAGDTGSSSAATSVAVRKSILVLPFVDMGNEPDQEYFAEGIWDSLITELSRLSGLLVVSRSAASRYRDRAVDPEEIGHDLGVGYVLEGSIRKSGDRVRVTAQLIDTGNGFQLWAERYDRDLEDIFAVQDDITQEIIHALQLELSRGEKQLVGQRTTENADAYDLLLQSRVVYRDWTPATNARAIELLERALDHDPSFALANVELARAYFQAWILSGSSEPQLLETSLQHGQTAVAKAPDLPEAHTHLGWAYIWKKDFEAGLSAMKWAVELDPNNAEPLARLSEALLFAGQPEEAFEYITEARYHVIEEPYYFKFWAGEILFYLNRHAEAARELETMIASLSHFFPARRILAAVYAETGRLEDAKAQIAAVLRLNPRLSLTVLRRQLPFRDPADLERQLDALRLAGLPE